MTDEEKAKAFADVAMKATGGRGVEAVPADLAMCQLCRKVVGPRGGWYGPECQCDRPPARGIDHSHSIQANPPGNKR